MFSIRKAAPALVICTLAAAPAAAQQAMEIVVNVPAGRLDVLQDGRRVRSYPVSVGTARFATPTAEAAIRRMVWNPSWTPPDSEWARDERPAAPGWGNPMGRVKMHLFGIYYIHGTPAPNERFLGRPASHGCIRMRNADAMELARMVLRADGAPVSDATLDALAANPGRTREIAMAGRVRVRIEYRLAELEQDSIILHPDVYARAAGRYAERVGQELRTLGEDPAPVVERLARSRGPATALRVARWGAAPVRPVPGAPAAGAGLPVALTLR
ncbi:MAG TPA: L,D-transpeptidase [Longimicrobium sp.]|nr:L,D-transpeptidase [Longimicrobium sp.]